MRAIPLNWEVKSSWSHHQATIQYIYILYIYKSPWHPIKSSFNTEFHRWVWRLTHSWIVEPCQKRIRRLQTVTQGERQDVRREPWSLSIQYHWYQPFGVWPRPERECAAFAASKSEIRVVARIAKPSEPSAKESVLTVSSAQYCIYCLVVSFFKIRPPPVMIPVSLKQLTRLL